MSQLESDELQITPTSGTRAAANTAMNPPKKRLREEEKENEIPGTCTEKFGMLDPEYYSAVKKTLENVVSTNVSSFGVWPIGEIGIGTGKFFAAQLSNLKGFSNFLLFRQGHDDLMSLGTNKTLMKLSEKGFSNLCNNADDFLMFSYKFQTARLRYENSGKLDTAQFEKLQNQQTPSEVLLERNVDIDGARGNIKMYIFWPTIESAFVMIQFLELGFMKKKYDAAKKNAADGNGGIETTIQNQNRSFVFKPEEFLLYIDAIVPFLAKCSDIVKEQGKVLCESFNLDLETINGSAQQVDHWKKFIQQKQQVDNWKLV